MATTAQNDNIAIEQWKLRRTIQDLSKLRGRGTSLITLIIPANSQLSRTTQLLTEEQGLSSCIKSPQTRHNVQEALSYAQGRLRLYTQNTLPANGLVIYAGIAYEEDETRERKISMCVEPLQPLQHGLYRCESHFLVNFLEQQLLASIKGSNGSTYGIMVVDGNGALFSCFDPQQGAVTLKSFQVSLPKKHGRGGQSAARFERLRNISIHNYLKKVAENAKSVYLNSQRNGLSNVDKIIISGSANLKHELVKSDLLGAQIQTKILRLVDVSYGGENGLQETIRLCSDLFSDMKLDQERQLINQIFDRIRIASNEDTAGQISYAVGVDEVSVLIEENASTGIIDRIIVWENLPTKRFIYQRRDQSRIIVLAEDQNEAHEKVKILLRDQQNEQIICIEQMGFLDYLTENYRNLNIRLDLVTDRTPEGEQFRLGFGGCIALLRYPTETSIFDSLRNDQAHDDIDDNYEY